MSGGDGERDGGPLLVRHRDGDPDAFQELVQLYRVRIYSYLVRSGIREGDRDDIFQEIFLTVHRQAARYDAALPLAPWLFTIAVNSVRNYFRAPARKREAAAEEAPETPDNSPAPQEILEGRELAAWLERELRSLPPDQRECMVLCYVKDIDQEEAARLLGMNTNTLKTNLRRARLTLAQKLTGSFRSMPCAPQASRRPGVPGQLRRIESLRAQPALFCYLRCFRRGPRQAAGLVSRGKGPQR